jgi:hypothetical protein
MRPVADEVAMAKTEDTMPHQAVSSSPDKPVARGKPDNPICPACRHVMNIRQVMPSTSMIGVSETVYVCESCVTETHRTAKRL